MKAQPEINPKVTLPPPDNISLKQARAFEEQERYSEAIQKYEDPLRRYPAAAEAQAISDRLLTLRQFQGSVTAANVAMERRRFGIARQNYKQALRLRPDSELAKLGLIEAESRINFRSVRERLKRNLLKK
jgi:tetratricopeptide (TPR) repeat protein